MSSTGAAALGEDVELKLLWTSKRAAVGDERLEQVFTNEEAFRTWWQAASGRTEGLPAVDFTSHVVVAVSAGLRPNACHDIEFVRARRGADAVVVEVRPRVPADDAICAMMMVHPTVVAAIGQPGGPVRFDWHDPAEAHP